MNRRRMVISSIAGTLVVAVLLLVATGTWAQGEERASPLVQADAVPSTISYQGRLLNADGSPVQGTHTMSFRIYAQESGGVALWSGSLPVQVEGGLFHVQLDVDPALFDGEALWLGVEVQGDGEELTPRQPLLPVPYALHALTAPWAGLTGVPAGLEDGDDDTTYTSGTGLSLVDTEFNISVSYRLPQSCGGGEIPEWDGSAWQCGGDDDTTYTAGTGLGLVGTEFMVDPSYRLPQSCGGGEIARWDGTSWQCGIDAVGPTGWLLTGNSGTDPTVDYLGTADGVSLTLAVSGTPALRLEPNGFSPNLIGGYGGNRIAAGVMGAVIGGGGATFRPNEVSADYGTMGGGEANTASGFSATVGGGSGNTASGGTATVGGGGSNSASGEDTTIGGGWGNVVSATCATVGGGSFNIAGGDDATVGGGADNAARAAGATVGGGESNIASGHDATVGGGSGNAASGGDSTVAGGYGNTASDNSATVGGGEVNVASHYGATVAGGLYNIASGLFSTVGGGFVNLAPGESATVGGGNENLAAGQAATISGGSANGATGYSATVGGGGANDAIGDRATIAGGWLNTASGDDATVPGGWLNTAGGDSSFAAGEQAQADHGGSFVWSSGGGDTLSWGANTFTARAHGGVRFYSAAGTTTGVQLSSGGSSWGSISDRNAKEGFADVDAGQVLATLVGMPIQTWNLKAQSAEMRHIGPVAQDFNGEFAYLFGEVESPTHINNMDAIGVALAAIQGLYARNQELEVENAALRAEVDDLETRLAAVEAAVGMPQTSGPQLSVGWLSFGMLGMVLLNGLVAVAVVVRRRRSPGGGL